jgi:peroxiredoxin
VDQAEAAGPAGPERAVDFTLPSDDGGSWTLSEHLARGPVVLVFYRGDW